MAKLIAKSVTEGLLPIQQEGVTLLELIPNAITSISTGDANQKTASIAMKETVGVALPSAGRSTGKEGARAIWMGPGQAFWLGVAPTIIKGATLTDQSDGWTMLRLEGHLARAVLARLVPIDLRVEHFKRGHSARTLLGHMSVSLTRVKENTYDILVFRSMTQTAVHELDVAMRSVVAQEA